MDKTPKYTWKKETGATEYQFKVKQGLFTVYKKTVDSSACKYSKCSNTPAEKLGYKTYKWKVRAKAGGVWGAWSSYKTFTVVKGFDSTFNSNMNGWKVFNGSWDIINSVYLKTNGVSGAGASIFYNQNFTKLNYQVRMKRFGCEGCANALLVRGTPYPAGLDALWDMGYYFAYNNYGQFVVYELNGGSLSALQSWTTSAAINPGGWNTLKVIADGSTLKFYINDILVWTGIDSTHTNGKVGIRMYRDSISTGNKIYVDWAELSTVDLSENLIEAQVEAGQVELEGEIGEMGPVYIEPNIP
jgi:hypothetical protein